ncbi:hypothetical protein K4K54_000402 [Colletotrichum sp. SAR 10_86]|nr:hypothetical protein K4K51_001830 [Colletotrichum sp. SAR 10_75]KAI8230890.1 hypothetical protein K4K54_000402 [Colletotrichum sp. SAR 10_86]KAI8254065.1 hypothetical protein K4K53_009445 [Colletotrichum sp. SAR 10_77]
MAASSAARSPLSVDESPQPHSCEICQDRLLFAWHYVDNVDEGWWEEISDHNYYATGRAYTFNISYGEALEQAQTGCELFAWLVTLHRPDTWDESWLRAYYTSPPEVHMVLDWVNDLDDHVDGGDPSRQVVVCAEEGVRQLVYGVEWTTMTDSEAFYFGWRDLLQYYSVMEAGQQQNRLLAISSVAKKIGGITNKKYSAGIWMNSPSDSLAWVSSSDKAKRLTGYFIPSWSWASVWGEVGLESCTPMEEFSIQHVQLKNRIPGDDFSALIEAQMKLQALTFPAHVRRDEELG